MWNPLLRKGSLADLSQVVSTDLSQAHREMILKMILKPG